MSYLLDRNDNLVAKTDIHYKSQRNVLYTRTAIVGGLNIGRISNAKKFDKQYENLDTRYLATPYNKGDSLMLYKVDSVDEEAQ